MGGPCWLQPCPLGSPPAHTSCHQRKAPGEAGRGPGTRGLWRSEGGGGRGEGSPESVSLQGDWAESCVPWSQEGACGSQQSGVVTQGPYTSEGTAPEDTNVLTPGLRLPEPCPAQAPGCSRQTLEHCRQPPPPSNGEPGVSWCGGPPRAGNKLTMFPQQAEHETGGSVVPLPL